MNRSKAKGTAYESALVTYFAEMGFDARRIVLHGNKDRGDIDIDGHWNAEAKDCKTHCLAQWMDECEVESVNAGKPVALIVKRARKNVSKSYVIMDLDTFIHEVLQ